MTGSRTDPQRAPGVDAVGACPPPPHPPGAPAAPGPPSPWTLPVVCLASGLLLFTVTAPNVALPAIGAALGAGFAELQWVLSSYALVLAGLLLAGGALADRYGRRRVFLAGLGVFAAGSVLCSVAWGAPVLVAGRVVQGVGAAALFPAGLAVLGAEYRGPARARAIGVWGAAVAGAIALGPLLGGVLVETAGWRTLFVACTALSAPLALVAARHLRESRTPAGRLDRAGTALLCAAAFVVVLVLDRAGAWGPTAPAVLAGVALAIGLVAAFALVEHRVPDPIIAPRLLRNRTFVAATAVAMLFAAAGFAPLVFIAQYLMTVAGAGPILAGLQLAPFAVAAFGVSLLAARVAARLGTGPTLALGLGLCTAGLGLLVLLGPPTTVLALLPGLLVFGCGAGLVNPTMTVAALGAVDPDHGGMAGGVNNAARQLGIAAGIAGFGAVVHTAVTAGVRDALVAAGVPGEAAATAATGAAGAGPGAVDPAAVPAGVLRDAYAAAYADALTAVHLLGLGIAAVAVVVVLVLLRDPARPSVAAR